MVVAEAAGEEAGGGGVGHPSLHAGSVAKVGQPFEQGEEALAVLPVNAGVVSLLLCKRIPKGRCAVHEILLQHEALPNTIRSGQIANIRAIIENGRADGMTTMDQSLMARVKDTSIAPLEAYMKAADKNLFSSLLQPGDLDAGH